MQMRFFFIIMVFTNPLLALTSRVLVQTSETPTGIALDGRDKYIQKIKFLALFGWSLYRLWQDFSVAPLDFV